MRVQFLGGFVFVFFFLKLENYCVFVHNRNVHFVLVVSCPERYFF